MLSTVRWTYEPYSESLQGINISAVYTNYMESPDKHELVFVSSKEMKLIIWNEKVYSYLFVQGLITRFEVWVGEMKAAV